MTEALDPSRVEESATAAPDSQDAPCARVAYTPRAALFDRAFAAMRPGIEAFAEHKNVPFLPGHDVPVLEYALSKISNTTMRRMLAGNRQATQTMLSAVDHALDVEMTVRMINFRILATKEDRTQDDIIAEAEQHVASLRRPSANDRGAHMIRWPDLFEMIDKSCQNIALRATNPPLFTLPKGAASISAHTSTRRSGRAE